MDIGLEGYTSTSKVQLNKIYSENKSGSVDVCGQNITTEIKLPTDKEGMLRFLIEELGEFTHLVRDVGILISELENQIRENTSKKNEQQEPNEEPEDPEMFKKFQTIIYTNFNPQFARFITHTVDINQINDQKKLKQSLIKAGYSEVKHSQGRFYFTEHNPVWIPTKHAALQYLIHAEIKDFGYVSSDVNNLRHIDVITQAGEVVLFIVSKVFVELTEYFLESGIVVLPVHVIGDEFMAIVYPNTPENLRKVSDKVRERLKGKKSVIYQSGSFEVCNVTLSTDEMPGNAETKLFVKYGIIAPHPSEDAINGILAQRIISTNQQSDYVDPRVALSKLILRFLQKNRGKTHNQFDPTNFGLNCFYVDEGYSNPYIDPLLGNNFPIFPLTKRAFNQAFEYALAKRQGQNTSMVGSYANKEYDSKNAESSIIVQADMSGIKAANTSFGKNLTDAIIYFVALESACRIAEEISNVVYSSLSHKDEPEFIFTREHAFQIFQKLEGTILFGRTGGKINIVFTPEFFERLEADPRYFLNQYRGTPSIITKYFEKNNESVPGEIEMYFSYKRDTGREVLQQNAEQFLSTPIAEELKSEINNDLIQEFGASDEALEAVRRNLTLIEWYLLVKYHWLPFELKLCIIRKYQGIPQEYLIRYRSVLIENITQRLKSFHVKIPPVFGLNIRSDVYSEEIKITENSNSQAIFGGFFERAKQKTGLEKIISMRRRLGFRTLTRLNHFLIILIKETFRSESKRPIDEKNLLIELRSALANVVKMPQEELVHVSRFRINSETKTIVCHYKDDILEFTLNSDGVTRLFLFFLQRDTTSINSIDYLPLFEILSKRSEVNINLLIFHLTKIYEIIENLGIYLRKIENDFVFHNNQRPNGFENGNGKKKYTSLDNDLFYLRNYLTLLHGEKNGEALNEERLYLAYVTEFISEVIRKGPMFLQSPERRGVRNRFSEVFSRVETLKQIYRSFIKTLEQIKSNIKKLPQ